jgi:hypothetical protein
VAGFKCQVPGVECRESGGGCQVTGFRGCFGVARWGQVVGGWWLVLAAAILALAALALAGVGPATAQDAPPIVYERYDVDIAVQPDGAFVVRETQQIRFGGQFSQGFTEIPLEYTTRVDDVTVFEGETPYVRNGSGPGSFTTAYEDGNLYVDWSFTPTEPGDVRTFTVAYTVVGGLWIYPDQDLLGWRAVPADRSGIPVLASVVVVTLPPDPATGQPVPSTKLSTDNFGHPASVQTTDGRVAFTGDGPIPDGVAFHVQVGFPHGIVDEQPSLWQLMEDRADLTYRYTAMDSDIRIEADGTVRIDAGYRIRVDSGALHQGFNTISHTVMDDVFDVAVLEGDQPFTLTDEICESCFSVGKTPRQAGWVTYDARYDSLVTDSSKAGATHLHWLPQPLVKGEETTFHLRYALRNALYLSRDGQTFNWSIVIDEQAAPVDSSTARITLPPGVDPARVQVTGGAVQQQPDGSLLLTRPQPIIAAEPWDISVVLPANATAAVKSQWQQDMENVRRAAQQAATRQARSQVLLGGLALLILSGGLLSLLLLWYRFGRDEPVPLPAEYIVEPPSELAPGIVAYLLDEQPSIDGVLASLFHLATLGLLRIRLAPEIAIGRNWDEKLSPGQLVEAPDGRTMAIPGHLATLFNNLMVVIETARSKPLDQIAGPLQAILPQVYAEMGQEIAPLFDAPPDQARGRWRALGVGITLLGSLALFYSCIASLGFGAVALAPGLALLLVGAAWIVASRWMPRRTPEGALEAAKWRAFRRYLLNLEDYGSQAEAQEILDRYFAYAVALDVQQVVLRDAERLEAHLPTWTRPVVITSSGGSWSGGSSSGGGSPFSLPTLSWQPAPASSSPRESGAASPTGGQPADQSLSGKSHQMGASLSQASLSLSRTLSAATGSSSSSTMDAMDRAVRSSSGTSSTRYSGSSRSSSSSSRSSSSSSSSRSSSSSSSSSRSSSSRSSGGGGRRGFS